MTMTPSPRDTITRAPAPRRGRLLAIIVLLLALGAWLWSRPGSTPTAADPLAAPSIAVPSLPALPPTPPRIDLRLAGRAAISGKVLDPRGQPVAGAIVCAGARSTLLPDRAPWHPTCAPSGRDGYYHLEGLLPVRHAVTASAPGHAPGIYFHGEGASRRDTIDLRPAMSAIDIDISLEDGGVEVTGVVRDLSGGPIEGAQVISDRAFAQTGPDGLFSLWVRPGLASLVADADGYAAALADGLAPGHHFELTLTPEAVLIGQVLRADTRAPIDGARVFAGGQGWAANAEVLTDPDGNFRIAGLEPGVYKPRAEADDALAKASEQVVLGLGETSATILLEAHPAFSITGRIIADGGAGCEEGFVSLRDRAHARTLYASPEVDGAVHFAGVLPGTYEVTLGCAGTLPADTYPSIALVDTSLSDLTWRVTRGRAIRGEVVDASGKPVPHVQVQAVLKLAPGQPPRMTSARADTDPHGRFELAGLTAGPHQLTLAGPRASADRPTEVTIPEQRDLEGVRIELPAGGQVRGSVLDPRGRPVPHITVTLQSGPQPATTYVADDGSFTLEHVAPGTYRAVAEGSQGPLRAPGASDDDPPGQQLRVRAGADETLKLVVESATGTISGLVRDGDGAPVADAFIEATRESESAAAGPGEALRGGRWSRLDTPVLTDADGRFTLTALPPGKHTLRAHRKGGGEAHLEHVEHSEHAEHGGEVVLIIAPTSHLSGTVLMPGGPPPDDFTVQLIDPTTRFTRRDSFFRTGGAWSLPQIPPGSYKLSIHAGSATAELDLIVRPGEDASGLRVELAPKLHVRGLVLDLDGQPVPNMLVVIRSGLAHATGAPGRATTDAAGRFELRDVPTGPVQVVLTPQANDAYLATSIPMQISAAAPTVELPAIRIAARRSKPGDAIGDLGYKLRPPAPGEPAPVVAVLTPGGPAALAGLRLGDAIVRVDGQDITGANAHLLRPLTTVPPGTLITLGLARGLDLPLTAGPP